MQQTETYQLNLIETSDTFSPAPLNENTQKLEGIIAAGTSAEAQARADADAALDARVTALEARKIAIGTYHGTGNTVYQTISVGFNPIFVLAAPIHNVPFTAIPGQTGVIEIVPGGFRVYSNANQSSNYNYLAIR